MEAPRSVSLVILVVWACVGVAIQASAAQASATQEQNRPGEKAADSPAGCPVTRPSDAFVPPAPYQSVAPAGSIYFGTPKLWTLLWMNSWQGRKLVWWSPGHDRETDSPPGLTVTFTRLDAAASPLMTDHSNWGFIPGQPPFITTGVNTSPIAGCWEITGRLKGDEVRYVVWMGRPPN